MKIQLVVDTATGTSICLAPAAGRRHAFRVLKESGVRRHPATTARTDTGDRGLQQRHGHTTLPPKRSKKNPLNEADKLHKRTISKDRVPAEHVIGAVTRFTIVSDRYRNRFGLRFTLIAVAYNKDLMP